MISESPAVNHCLSHRWASKLLRQRRGIDQPTRPPSTSHVLLWRVSCTSTCVQRVSAIKIKQSVPDWKTAAHCYVMRNKAGLFHLFYSLHLNSLFFVSCDNVSLSSKTLFSLQNTTQIILRLVVQIPNILDCFSTQHTTTMRRFSYYYVKPTHSTLERREDNNHTTIWRILAIILAVVAILAVLMIIYRRARVLLQHRRYKSRGQGFHLHSRPLRTKQKVVASDDIEHGISSPFSDKNNTDSVYSTYANMPSRPLSTYWRRSSRSAYSQQMMRYSSSDDGGIRRPYTSDFRHSYDDGFEPTPRDGAQPTESHYGRRF